jgi:hypothetical protein
VIYFTVAIVIYFAEKRTSGANDLRGAIAPSV